MKKVIILILVSILVGIVSTAASPLPPPTQTLQGIMLWQGANLCGASDYVPLPAMTNVYLTGKFTPTHGLFQGCRITASGFFYTLGQCHYFSVSAYKTDCPTTAP